MVGLRKRALEGMGTGELRALIREAGEVLRTKEVEEKERLRNERIATLGEGGTWLEHQLVNCGNCRRCGIGGYHHGPYWYLYSYTNGKMKSAYVGRKLKEEIAADAGCEEFAGLTPEEAYPDDYEST